MTEDAAERESSWGSRRPQAEHQIFAPLNPPEEQDPARNPPPGYQVITGPDGRPVVVPRRGAGRGIAASPQTSTLTIVVIVIFTIVGLAMVAAVLAFLIALGSIGSNK